MTSFPVCKKTSLSRKLCMIEVKLLKNTNRKSWSPFQNLSWKIPCGAPQRRYHHDVISGLQENLIISDTMHDRGEVTKEHKQEVMVTLSETVIKNSVRCPLQGDITTTSFPVCKKTSLCLKRCPIEAKLLKSTNRKSWSPFRYPFSKCFCYALQRICILCCLSWATSCVTDYLIHFLVT